MSEKSNERFILAIGLNGNTIASAKDVATALRFAADKVQSTGAWSGDIEDERGRFCGQYALQDVVAEEADADAAERGAAMKDHALNQIQTIAHDATLDDDDVDRPGELAIRFCAALERIQHIAEAQSPDEDWRPVMEESGS